MYEKCITCDRLGKECIPNLYVMEYEEIREWIKALKEHKGITNAELARLSGVPKGTIDYNFSKGSSKHDVNYSTFSAILCALIGCEEERLNCGSYIEGMEQLKEENELIKNRMHDMKSEYDERITYYREQLKWRKQVIVTLIIISCILLIFVLAELSVDWINENFGMFWR